MSGCYGVKLERWGGSGFEDDDDDDDSDMVDCFMLEAQMICVNVIL